MFLARLAILITSHEKRESNLSHHYISYYLTKIASIPAKSMSIGLSNLEDHGEYQ
jgi:hypothetical protein